MTAREYAKSVGIEIVGKLTRKVRIHERYDANKDKFVEARTVFYIDEIGNEFMPCEVGNWVAITFDGACI